MITLGIKLNLRLAEIKNSHAFQNQNVLENFSK